MEEFTPGTPPVLPAGGGASRGIHVEGVTHVINYDLPQHTEDYVHRIGRTGRAGASGKAISLADEEYVYSLDDIEKYISRKIPVEWADESMYVREIRRSKEEMSREKKGPAAARHPSPRRRFNTGEQRQRR